MRSFKDSNFLFRQLQATWENAAVVAPLIVGISLFFGVIFYSIVNGWDISLSYFFAANVLFGDMYLVPTEPNPWSHVFTLFYFLWGTTLLAGAITSAANMIVNSAVRIAAEERKRFFASSTGEYSEEPVAGYLARLLRYFQWSKYRSKYIALSVATGWICVGTCYAVIYEEWPISESILFAIAAVSTAGSIPPPCDGPDATYCEVGTFRAIFVGTYIVIGVPLFAYTVGQFAEILVERAIKANEMKLMARPLTPQEFRFAFELHRGEIVVDNESSVEEDADEKFRYNSSLNNSADDKELNSEADVSLLSMRSAFRRQKSWRGYSKPHSIRLTLEDFIILEMLRLQKITSADLHYIKMLFDSLDEDGDGVILSPDEGIQLGREVSSAQRTESAHAHDDADKMGELLPNTAQKLTRSASKSTPRNFRPPPISLTSSFVHPSDTSYGSLYAIPEHSTISERDDMSEKMNSQFATSPTAKISSDVHEPSDDNEQNKDDIDESATVIDDDETLEALRKLRVSTESPNQPTDLRSLYAQSRTRQPSRKGDSHLASLKGKSPHSSRSSRSNSRVGPTEMQLNSKTSSNEEENFFSPIQPLFSRQRSSRSPSSYSARWGVELSPNEERYSPSLRDSLEEAEDDGPFVGVDVHETEADEASGLEKISSQYNRLILSRLNQMHRQATAPASSPTPPFVNDNLEESNVRESSGSALREEMSQRSDSLWGSVLSSVKDLVRPKRAVSESAVPPPNLIQLAPFRNQPAGKRRLSLSGASSSGKALQQSESDNHLPTIEEESSSLKSGTFSFTSSKKSLAFSRKQASQSNIPPNGNAADWSIGDWIDAERGHSLSSPANDPNVSTCLSPHSGNANASDNFQAQNSEKTPLLPKK